MTQAPLDLSVAGKDPTDSAKAAITRATRLQRQGADPERSAWVTASAGSGKTKVLGDRVLRLLL
ncbi:MAG TPA: UvrD-helicase domain-containing protein, partial [Dongiaceae bacterium]